MGKLKAVLCTYNLCGPSELNRKTASYRVTIEHYQWEHLQHYPTAVLPSFHHLTFQEQNWLSAENFRNPIINISYAYLCHCGLKSPVTGNGSDSYCTH